MWLAYAKIQYVQETAKGKGKKHQEVGDKERQHIWLEVLSSLCCLHGFASQSWNVCPPSFPSSTTRPRTGFLSFSFHVDEKGRSVLAIPLQLRFGALLKGDNISLLKGRGVISRDIMKVSVQVGMFRSSRSSMSSKPLLLLIAGLTICPSEARRYGSIAISPESHPTELPEEWYGSASVAPSACWNGFRRRLMSEVVWSLPASPQGHLVSYGLQTGLLGFSYTGTGYRCWASCDFVFSAIPPGRSFPFWDLLSSLG